jgi:Kef-type K+ transport system membrane component KefB
MEPFLTFLIHIRDTFNDHVIFGVGVLLVMGYFFGKLAERVRLPAITGYIVAGLLLGDSISGIIHTEMTETLRTITEVALGIIAITIGSEFGFKKLRRLGAGIVLITLVQLFVTFFVVAFSLRWAGMAWPYALMLGAIASATAPAATVVIIQQLRARGDFVDTLYGVVALDDAGCVVLFAAVLALAGSMLGAAGGEALSFMASVGHAFTEIIYSLILGVAEGAILHMLCHRNRRSNEMLIISLGVIFLSTAIAISLELSPLLANMTAGAVVINISQKGHRIFRAISPLTPPLYAAFFAIAGTELKLAVLANPVVLGLGVVYVLSRAAGKYSGVWLGALAAKVPRTVRTYLGFSMLPQAGVAIGLVLLVQASPLTAYASEAVKEQFVQMANIVLFAVMINELIGPPLSKYAIIRGAEL